MDKPIGRPTTFTQKIADEICERIADGESLRSICRSENMPAKSSVFKWLGEMDAFSDQYARARDAQADSLFDDILEIADDARNDWMEHRGEKSLGYELNGEHVQRTRMRIDARKWMAGKLKPKAYGEKIDIAHSGGIAVSSVEWTVVDPKDED